MHRFMICNTQKIIVVLGILWLILPPLLGQADNLQSGPMVGYSNMREVMLWVQTRDSAKVIFRYWEKDTPRGDHTKGNGIYSQISGRPGPTREAVWLCPLHRRTEGCAPLPIGVSDTIPLVLSGGSSGLYLCHRVRHVCQRKEIRSSRQTVWR